MVYSFLIFNSVEEVGNHCKKRIITLRAGRALDKLKLILQA